MPRVLRASVLLALALAGVTWLAGCSVSPVGPGSNAIVNPEFVKAPAPPAGALGATPTSASAKIDGGKGGSVKFGRFTITVPKRAYEGQATITISAPDPTVLVCDLAIAPGAANDFAVPVTLTTDWSGTNVTDPTSLLVVWFDEAAGVWREVPGQTVDTEKETVSVPLSHFSTYGVLQGRAGW